MGLGVVGALSALSHVFDFLDGYHFLWAILRVRFSSNGKRNIAACMNCTIPFLHFFSYPIVSQITDYVLRRMFHFLVLAVSFELLCHKSSVLTFNGKYRERYEQLHASS